MTLSLTNTNDIWYEIIRNWMDEDPRLKLAMHKEASEASNEFQAAQVLVDNFDAAMRDNVILSHRVIQRFLDTIEHFKHEDYLELLEWIRKYDND